MHTEGISEGTAQCIDVAIVGVDTRPRSTRGCVAIEVGKALEAVEHVLGTTPAALHENRASRPRLRVQQH
eukprot:11530617-Alexandrium_andersonii.AAC.1